MQFIDHQFLRYIQLTNRQDNLQHSQTTSCMVTANIIWEALTQKKEFQQFNGFDIHNKNNIIFEQLNKQQGIIHVQLGEFGFDHYIIFVRTNQNQFKLLQSWQDTFTYDTFRQQTQRVYFDHNEVFRFIRCLTKPVNERKNAELQEAGEVARLILTGNGRIVIPNYNYNTTKIKHINAGIWIPRQ